ncbi:MAG: excinuclease ABC subunit UvrA [Schleiferiaceae bacterium]|jgi:excinuclease ABC subunit A|nr:excinuclease ABC subunit UvrA [Schleiferiaceae bacterium]MDG1919258.1 excinuclease ABC subunit UvrA [Schleiferiaceae bacterium]MDG2109530.1 excinuclease ABC subunit UvrA [Schleiferiaceae bacterium]
MTTHIEIKRAAVHNLKEVSVNIPRNQLVVITGVSGSGKSSLAFDTLFAEGQRRYVESLSAYARQFLGKLDKPKVEYIKGIPPAVAIQQKVSSRNPRSTVGTTTEIYDYLKLLFARIGKTYSPVSGELVKRHNVSDVMEVIHQLGEGTRFLITAPVTFNDRTALEHLSILSKQGFARILVNDAIVSIDEIVDENTYTSDKIQLVVDRAVVRVDDEDNDYRLQDSIQTAFYEGRGACELRFMDDRPTLEFNSLFELDGMSFTEPTLHLFSFNNPLGACPSCEGFGSIMGIDADLVVPNPHLSVYEGCVAPWKGDTMGKWKDKFILGASAYDFPVHRPYIDLTEKEKTLLWEGAKGVKGINALFKHLESKSYKIQFRVMLSRYRGRTVCSTCKGKRLKPEANYVKVGGRSLSDLVELPLRKLKVFFQDLNLDEQDASIAKRLLTEITTRIDFLISVGLPYLTLNRVSSTLSGGESQRIQLATSLGSSLVGSLYILDEPSIGLHPKDAQQLITVIEALRDNGNTVVVVEHEEAFMRAADFLIDIGPAAGNLGGEILAAGIPKDVLSHETSLTAAYLNGTKQIPLPQVLRKPSGEIILEGVRQHNLKGFDVSIPLGVFSVVAGVSGSGKSTLIKQILYPALKKHLEMVGERPGLHKALKGDLNAIQHVEMVDQNPIGKSSRSNPVTYLKAYDDIRNLYASEELARVRGYKAKHFSFNTDGGRCDTCKGEGEVTIEMQFMADVHLPCEACNGKRFKAEILEVKFHGKTISDLLDCTIDEVIEFFKKHNQMKIAKKLQPLQDVGLGYAHVGQSSSTLSGGEAQRVKLAFFLSKGIKNGKTLFLFDEPTTGLHFDDVKKLLRAFNELVDLGHTVLVIEHDLDVIKRCDHVIEIGPEGGELGGQLLYTGSPNELISVKGSPTAEAMKSHES